MNSSLIRRTLLAAIVVALLPVPGAMAHAAQPTGPPAERYIVTLRQGAVVEEVADAAGIPTFRSYSFVLNGFAASATAGQLEALLRHPDVAAVEQDRRWAVESPDLVAHTPTPNWGLDRIDQRGPQLDNIYLAPSTGFGVRVYLLDAAINPNHPGFGGRAEMVFDAFPGEPRDCLSHGTWTAGIVGSDQFGVARNVAVKGVRVVDCQGEATTESILAGMDFIGNHGQKPAVVNIALGGPSSTVLDLGAKALWDNSFFVSASAGNNGTDACEHSPSRAVYAVTSVNHLDRNTNDSHGKCVDIYAPGADSTSLGAGAGFFTGAGTSAAASFVAGAAALYKAAFGDAPSETVAQWLNANATVGVVQQNVPPTPNRLLFLPPGMPQAPPGDTFGYVFANLPQEPSYVPSPLLQRNISGLPNRVVRSGPGTYRVHLPGLAAGGVAHVAGAGGPSGADCRLTGDSAVFAEHVVDVRCSGPDGQPLDGTFVASYARAESPLQQVFGYVKASVRSPGPGGPVYGASVSYNSTGQDNTVTRVSAGVYQIDFPGLGVTLGTAVVSAMSPDPRNCATFSLLRVGTTERVRITCRDLAGQPADSLFTVTFTDTRSMLGTVGARGHALVPQPGPAVGFNSSGGPISVRRSAEGSYEVTFANLGSSTAGHVMVAALGQTASRCRATGWGGAGPDQRIAVQCRTLTGQPGDAEFIVQFVW